MASYRKKAEPPASLTPAEWDVMEVLWEKGNQASRDIAAVLAERRAWSASTVKTMLGRLVAKGAVDYVEVGNSYLYRAALEQNAARAFETENYVERVHAGKPLLAVAHLIESTNVSAKDIDRLREMLDDKERRQRKGSR